MYKQMVPYLLLFFFALVFADPKIVLDSSPLYRIYEDGRVERILGTEIIPASIDPKTNVESKDIQYEPQYNLSVRLFLPENTTKHQKLPLLVFFHGGAFIIQSPFSPTYHNHLNTLVGEANIIAVSVEYRRAPEHPLPCAHNDSWTALKWVASHAKGKGPEEWLNRHADFGKVFFYGDSAGANIAHNMGMRHGLEVLEGVNVIGIVLCHPFFIIKEPLDGEKNDTNEEIKNNKWLQLIYPSARGLDDPLINPAADPNLAKLGCIKLLDLVAGKDSLRHEGKHYYDLLIKSGWKGNVQIFETPGEDHVFHLRNPTSENALALLKQIASFVNNNSRPNYQGKVAFFYTLLSNIIAAIIRQGSLLVKGDDPVRQ